jgi:tRNA G26 N,N-dimethylase Trm1
MGSKRLDKISDYSRHGFDLQVWCKCGHKAKIDAAALTKRLHKQRRSLVMMLIEPHLKCSKCGRRDVNYGPIWAEPVAMGGDSYPQ